jgi:dienelactone hydrolase
MANALLQVGIATFEIDMWTPRRLRDGVNSVPRPAIEMLPDAFGALKFLSSLPLIDPTRIGITGFSLGGAVSMLTASKPLADQYGPPGLRFRAHAPLYPVCWAYNSAQRPQYVFRELTGAPILIQGGELDTYDEPDTCQKLVESLPDASRPLVRLKMYPGATHKFDAAEPEHAIKDRAANLGRGGEVRVVPNPAAAEMAREATARFFVEVFGLAQ